MECPRCFYLDRRRGVGRPPGFPFNLNSAVDHLLKKEFDIHRGAGTKHPIMVSNNLEAVPFAHEKMNTWRETDFGRGGVRFLHEPTNFEVNGAVDDIWINPEGELYVVDYKATSKDGAINLDAPWQIGYKRQMEVYQWLLRGNGFRVSDTGYFVYCNGRKDVDAFDQKLEFDIHLIGYEGNDGWVESALTQARQCLVSEEVPIADKDCDFCRYRLAVKAEQVD